MKTAFIICSRLGSSRVPQKVITPINGVPLIKHLIRRLRLTGVPIILAIPPGEQDVYLKALAGEMTGVDFYIGSADDPLARMSDAADRFGVDHIIRVTHDKIFVDPESVQQMLDVYYGRSLDYAYSSKLVDGTGFEIIRRGALRGAAAKFQNVEYIGYAVRSVTTHVLDVQLCNGDLHSGHRLLIDYPADLALIETILAAKGNDCTTRDAIEFLVQNKWAPKINRLPKLTIYTCVYNGEKFIERAMGSVSSQIGFKDFEYIIVDDHSIDRTTQMISRFSTLYPNVRWIRNPKNLGLASSSNVVLKAARGKYIMRLDADDCFASNQSALDMLSAIESANKDAIYPDCYFGSRQKIQHGRDAHHIGGAIFSTRAINHVKFTDGLRGYEGLDVFLRAKDQLNIGYHDQPMFFYTQRPDSMSKTNLDDREKIKREIHEKASGN